MKLRKEELYSMEVEVEVGRNSFKKNTAISNAPLTLLCTLENGKQNDGK